MTSAGLTSGHDLATAQLKKREETRLEQRRVRSKLVAATVFAVVFMSVEVAGGILAGSLAIVTDAAHLFTDVANFITAIMASHLSETPASSKHSYGLVRAEVLSALINTGVIVVLAAYLIYEAIRRIVSWCQGTAEPIDGFLMMVIAIIGVLFNIVLMLIFGHEHAHAHGGHDHGGHSHGGHSHAGHSHANGHSHSHDEEEAGHGHGHSHDDDHHHEEEEEEGEEAEEDHGGHAGHLHHRGRHHSTSSHGSHHSHGGGRSSRHASHDSTHSHDSHSHGRKSRSSTSTSEKGGLLEPNEVVTVTTTYGSLPATHHDSHDSHDAHEHDEEQLSGSATKLTGPKKKKKKKKAKKHRNINLEAAHLHVITDLVQSIGVALAGVLIYFKPHWQVVDPICTILFSIAICYSVVSMLAKSTHVLLEGVPEGVDPDDLHDKLRAIDGVTDVHDLHIWMLSIGRPLVTVHIKAADPDVAMKEAQAIFTKAGIDHITIQIQRDECLPNECAHPCVSVACVSTSSQDGNSPGRGGGCTYL